MKKITFAAILFFVFCIPFIGTAHPGHGESDGFTITHYFTETNHLIVMSLVAFVVAVYFRHLRRNKQTK